MGCSPVGRSHPDSPPKGTGDATGSTGSLSKRRAENTCPCMRAPGSGVSYGATRITGEKRRWGVGEPIFIPALRNPVPSVRTLAFHAATTVRVERWEAPPFIRCFSRSHRDHGEKRRASASPFMPFSPRALRGSVRTLSFHAATTVRVERWEAPSLDARYRLRGPVKAVEGPSRQGGGRRASSGRSTGGWPPGSPARRGSRRWRRDIRRSRAG